MRIAPRALALATVALATAALPAAAQSGGFQLDPTGYAEMASNAITGFGPSLTVEYISSTAPAGDALYFEGYASSTFTQVFEDSQLSVTSSTYEANDAPSVALFGWAANSGVVQFDMVGSAADYSLQIDDRIGDIEAVTVVVATPEPASMTLLSTGLIGLFGFSRRRRA